MPALSVERAIRRARILAGSFLVYLAIVPFAVEKFVAITPQTTDKTLRGWIYFVCAAEIGVALFIRHRHPLIHEEVAFQQDESSRAGKWLATQIVSYAIAISIALYGIAFRVLGAPLRESVAFYGVAFVLLLCWWPRRA